MSTHVTLIYMLKLKPTQSKTMKSQIEQKFSDFLESWLSQLEDLVKQLVDAGTTHDQQQQEDPNLRSLVSKFTTHLKLYYTVKWAHAHVDVLAFYSPPWLSPLEAAYTWVTGWKPSTAFRLLPALSPDQLLTIRDLRRRIKSEERRVDADIERQQMAIAGHHIIQLFHLEMRRGNGDTLVHPQLDALVDVAIKALLDRLEKTMKAADCVRLKTLKEILDVLTPLQCVRFLASFSLIQIRLRRWGSSKFLATPTPTK